MIPTEFGYYWVKVKSEFEEGRISGWIPAQFGCDTGPSISADLGDGFWMEFGSEVSTHPDSVVEIGPKIEEPVGG